MAASRSGNVGYRVQFVACSDGDADQISLIRSRHGGGASVALIPLGPWSAHVVAFRAVGVEQVFNEGAPRGWKAERTAQADAPADGVPTERGFQLCHGSIAVRFE